MSATDELLANNAVYADGFSKGGLPMPPAKQIAIVACMDARLETGRLLGLEEGERRGRPARFSPQRRGRDQGPRM